MKKFLIISLLIQASIICSTRKYQDFEIEWNHELISEEGNINKKIYQDAYRQSLYTENGKDGSFVDSSVIEKNFQKFFELGKNYATELYKPINDKFSKKITSQDKQIDQLEKQLKDQTLIQCLNNYSTPAKIGFGVAGIIVAASLVYSGRQLYFFGKRKYSDWKAKKEESES